MDAVDLYTELCKLMEAGDLTATGIERLYRVQDRIDRQTEFGDDTPEWHAAFNAAYVAEMADHAYLTYTECDAIGVEGSGVDGSERWPYTLAKLTAEERQTLAAYRADGGI